MHPLCYCISIPQPFLFVAVHIHPRLSSYPAPPRLNLDLRNSNGETALWLSLKQLDATYLTCEDVSEYEYTFASRLVKRGANADAVDTRTGNSLLHQAALESSEAAAVFLVQHGAVPNHKNAQGETPIHIAAKHGLSKLVEVLLQYGADPNLQTALKPKSVKPAPVAIQAVKSDDFAPSILSPSTLGALSALTVTSHASYSAYSIERSAATAAGYSSTGPPSSLPRTPRLASLAGWAPLRRVSDAARLGCRRKAALWVEGAPHPGWWSTEVRAQVQFESRLQGLP